MKIHSTKILRFRQLIFTHENIRQFEIFDSFDDESLSLVKRTAGPDAQRFRPRQRQLNNFAGGLKSSFSLPDIVNNEYSAERWNGTWISDTEFAYRNRQGDLAILR